MDERPLVITDDDKVLEDLLRLAAAASVEVSHSREPGSPALWRSASTVLLDAALVRDAVESRMARRPGVVVIASGEPSPQLWEFCVRLGVERTVPLDGSDELLIALLSDAMVGGPGDGRCIAVIGACGGAGASVFAGAIALAAARQGGEVILADCDLWGAGLDVLFGLEHDTGLRWGDLAASSGRLRVAELQRAVPSVRVGGGLITVLCQGRAAAAGPDADVLDVVLDAGRRAGTTTVVDLPRQPSPMADKALERADLTVLLTPADVRGCWAADRVNARVRQFGTRAGLVVRGPSPGGIGAADLAAVLGLPLLARMRADPAIPRDLEFGLIPAGDRRRPLGRAASTVLAALDIRR